MDKSARIQSGLESGASIIRTPFPSQWESSYLAYVPRSRAACLVTTLLALIFPLVLLWSLRRYRKMQEENRKPFPFLELPQELRDMVYEHLMEDPAYPPPPPCSTHSSSIWRIPGRRASTSPAHKSHWIFLANKQIYKEYIDMLCKKTTFHLTVSPLNYTIPTPLSSSTSSTSSTSTPTSPPLEPLPTEKIWNISPDTLKNLRTASLKLITTSAMLGVSDPRNMTSSDWTLARQIRDELKHLSRVTNLTLDAKAIGDPLWNPLWIWYHASQSFKIMGTTASDTIPVGPKLNRITFSLDTWSPGENYLQRDDANKGAWTWFCMKGHNVGLDCGPEMTVREFCGKLYQECKVCRPELEDEDEEE